MEITKDERKLVIKKILISFLICLALIVFCYWFVDRSVALWINQHQWSKNFWLERLTYIQDILYYFILVIYIILAVRFLLYPLTLLDNKFLVIANSTAITELIHTPIKIIFGRYWPTTWDHNNLSFITNHVYGFQWFHFGSFPSGHAAVVAAFVMSIYWIFPRYKWLAIFILFIQVASLLACNYHFVSDIIGGCYLGGLVAFLMVTAFRQKLQDSEK